MMICFSFPSLGIPFYSLESNFSEPEFRVPTTDILGFRVQQLFPNSATSSFIVVGGYLPPFRVAVCQVSLEDRSGSEIVSLKKTHTSEVYGMDTLSGSLSASPRIFSAGLSDGEFHVSDAETGECLSTCHFPPSVISRLLHVAKWNPGEIFVSGRGLHSYDFVAGKSVIEYSSAEVTVALSVSVEDGLLFAPTMESSIRVFSRGSNHCEMTVKTSKRGISSFYAKDLNVLIVGMYEGGIEVWDIRQPGKRLHEYLATEYDMRSVHEIDRVNQDTFVAGTGEFMTKWKIHSGSRVGFQQASCPVHGVCVLRGEEEEIDSAVDNPTTLLRFLFDELLFVSVRLHFDDGQLLKIDGFVSLLCEPQVG